LATGDKTITSIGFSFVVLIKQHRNNIGLGFVLLIKKEAITTNRQLTGS